MEETPSEREKLPLLEIIFNYSKVAFVLIAQPDGLCIQQWIAI